MRIAPPNVPGPLSHTLQPPPPLPPPALERPELQGPIPSLPPCLPAVQCSVSGCCRSASRAPAVHYAIR